MNATLDISPDMQRQAFDYYACHRRVTINAIAVFLGIDRRTFWSLRRKWDWPPRAEALAAPRGSDPPASALSDSHRPDEPRPQRSLREAAAALAHVTRMRLDALIGDQIAQAEIDHDRTARILAAYAKTLTIAQSLLDQEETNPHEAESDASPPRNLDELRDELASHLERIVAEEEAAGSDGLLV
jgi:hypothetical protein